MDKVPFPLALIFLVGCNDPNIDLCAINFKDKILQCSNMRTDAYSEIPLEKAHKFIAMSPEDYERLRIWYKSGCDDSFSE